MLHLKGFAQRRRAKEEPRDDKESLKSRKSIHLDLPITSESVSPIDYICAILLQLAVTTILAVVSIHDVLFPLEDDAIDEPITNRARTGYTAGITLLATILSTFSLGQIKRLWLQRNVSRVSKESSVAVRESNTTLIGLSSVPEKFRRWNISLVLVISALCTTGIVTGLTPSIVVHSSPMESLFSSGGAIDTDDPFFTWPSAPACFHINSNVLKIDDWSWKMTNGSILSATEHPHCPPQRVVKTLTASEDFMEGNFLNIGGITVDRSAVGVPFLQAESGDMLWDHTPSFGARPSLTKSKGFRWASQCLPVLTRNPVKCRRPAIFDSSLGSNQSKVTFHSDDENCSITLSVANPFNLDLDTGALIAGRGCSKPQDPGKATLLIGAVGQRATLLYRQSQTTIAPNDTDDKPPAPSKDFYGLVCEIDMKAAIGYQVLNLSTVQQGGQQYHFSRLSITSPGRKPCTPTLDNGTSLQDLRNYLQTDTALAAGAGASMDLFSGAQSNLSVLTSSINTLWRLGNVSFFPDSTNAVEDVLGLASAVAIGMHWGSATNLLSNRTFILTSGTFARTRARIGSKDTKAILCIFPSAFTMIILIFLAVDNRRHARNEKIGSEAIGSHSSSSAQ